MSTAYEQWTHLTFQEKVYLATHPINALLIKSSKEEAFAETGRRFGINGHNDDSDAFRHCYWSAMLARDIGYMDALIFTTAHESGPNNPADEKAMDLHNNEVGLGIGKYFFFPSSNTELSDKCYEAYQQGKLQTSP